MILKIKMSIFIILDHWNNSKSEFVHYHLDLCFSRNMKEMKLLYFMLGEKI